MTLNDILRLHPEWSDLHIISASNDGYNDLEECMLNEDVGYGHGNDRVLIISAP